MDRVDLSKYDNSWYSTGASITKRALWYAVNAFIFDTWLCPSSAIKCHLLRAFGAKVKDGVIIKPRVNIKYPWLLSIGSSSWIGEGVWIDNLTNISIGCSVCISQGAYLLTGNHDYRDLNFGLIIKPIEICDGSWIGARAIVCPGVVMQEGSVLTAGSVLQRSSEAFGIYSGQPAKKIRLRVISPLKKSNNSSTFS